MKNSNRLNIEKYIHDSYSTLSDISYSFINDKSILIEKLFQCITTAKYRRTKLSDDTIKDIKKKIYTAVEEHKPIEFSFPFGGCKLWHFEEFPQPDWAEFFNMLHMVSYLKRICAFYEPGAILTYSSGDAVMSIANNIQQKYTKEYIHFFRELLNRINQKTPENLFLDIIQIKSLYSEKEFNDEFSTLLKNKYAFFSLSENQTLLNDLLKSAQNNLHPNGIQDYSNYSKSAFAEQVKDSAIKLASFLEMAKRRKFNKKENRIQVVNINGPSLSIHLGSCMRSSVQFWVGVGVCEINNGKLGTNILSSSQLLKYNDTFNYEYFEIDSFLSDHSRNYQKIRLYHK